MPEYVPSQKYAGFWHAVPKFLTQSLSKHAFQQPEDSVWLHKPIRIHVVQPTRFYIDLLVSLAWSVWLVGHDKGVGGNHWRNLIKYLSLPLMKFCNFETACSNNFKLGQIINCLQPARDKFETQQSKNESALAEMPVKTWSIEERKFCLYLKSMRLWVRLTGLYSLYPPRNKQKKSDNAPSPTKLSSEDIARDCFQQYKYIRCTEESSIRFFLHLSTGRPSELSVVTEGMELNSNLLNPVTALSLFRSICIFSFTFISVSKEIGDLLMKKMNKIECILTYTTV